MTNVVPKEVTRKAIRKAVDDSDDLSKQHLARIRSVQRRIETIEQKLADAKEEVAAFKSDLKLANKELREEIADGTGRLPFKEPGDQASSNGEAWRGAPIGELELPLKLCNALADAGLGTLGALADYTAAEKRLTDIKGVGQAAAEKIEKKLDQWWEKYPLAKAVAS